MTARTHAGTADGPATAVASAGPGCLTAFAGDGDSFAAASLCSPPPPPSSAPVPPPPVPPPTHTPPRPPGPEPKAPGAAAPASPRPTPPPAALRAPQLPLEAAPAPPPSLVPATVSPPTSHVMPRAYHQSVTKPAKGGASLVMLTLVLTAPAVLAAALLRPRSGSRSR
ncbi:hypothetical protein AB0F13_16815 [Streptomyces sp. NPDC026206]|uniref:hypothetical protein n=1 Tax=Streptomyces sp. NPDC026206 TaxID=3157089 RepID=UPI003408DEA7